MSPRQVHLAAVAVLMTLAVGAAWAHATLVRADPAPNAHVTRPPAVLRLEFNEAVLARTSRIELVAPDSQRFDLGIRNDSADAKVLIADVPALRSHGRYHVEWRLVGRDGHPITGRYSFSLDSLAVVDSAVGIPPSTEIQNTPQDPRDVALTTSLRFLSSLTTTLFIGATAFMLLVLPRIRSARTSVGLYDTVVEGRIRILAWVSLVALLPVLLVRLLNQGAALGGTYRAIQATDLMTIIAGTSWGRAWSVVLIAAISALVMLRRPRRRTDRTRWGGVALTCLAIAAAAPFLGHPAASDATGIAISLDAVHMLAAGGWAGTIMVIGLVALPVTLRAQQDDRVLMIKSLLGSFTPIALTSAVLLALSGTGTALLQLGRVAALWQTPYGLALIRKLVLVAGVAILGAWHWRVGQGTIARARSITGLRWSIMLDVVVVVGVIALTAVLTGTPPPTD